MSKKVATSIHERNRYWLYGDMLLIECYYRNHERSLYFIVDSRFEEVIRKHKWHISKQGYPCTRINDTIRKVHQVLLSSGSKDVIDHINQDKLDNRLVNLRFVDKRINARNSKRREDNTSGIRGVCKHRSGKWRAYINTECGQIHLGLFYMIEQAALARYEAEKEYF